jgi:hypothetical protein
VTEDLRKVALHLGLQVGENPTLSDLVEAQKAIYRNTQMAIAKAVAVEREACAKIAENHQRESRDAWAVVGLIREDILTRGG